MLDKLSNICYSVIKLKGYNKVPAKHGLNQKKRF